MTVMCLFHYPFPTQYTRNDLMFSSQKRRKTNYENELFSMEILYALHCTDSFNCQKKILLSLKKSGQVRKSEPPLTLSAMTS